MTVETDQPAAQLRFPLRAWLALAGMVVLVGTAGYAMYGRLVGSGPPSRDLVEISSARRPVDFGQPRVVPDGVRDRGNNIYQVKAGEGLISISRSRDGQWNYSFSYDKPDLVSQDQQAAFTARFRLVRDATYAKQLNVTPEQIKALNAIPAREGMVVSDADRQHINALFEAYVKAPPPRDAQTAALVAAMREVANRSLGPTRQALGERVKEIQAILTPEQIAPFKRN